MESEHLDKNYQPMGLGLQKKRKSRRRGKQTRKVKDAENESPDSDVFEIEPTDNESVEENTILSINNCKLVDDQEQITYDNESMNHSRITTDAFVSQSSVENESTQYPISEADDGGLLESESLGIRNLISDDNTSIFIDGTASSCIKGNEESSSATSRKVYEPIELGREDIKITVCPPTPTAVQEEQELYNSKALPKTAPTYELEKFGKHVLIILNHKEFYGPATRFGTEQDVKALTKTFKALDFDVFPYTDRTKAQVKEILAFVSAQDFTDYGCVAIAVLTHGNDNGELHAKDDVYTEMDIINSLKKNKNPSMITKPRLLIIQACRGTKAIAGVPVLRRGRIRTDLNYETEPYTLPVEADMLVLHSSYAGNPAHRHETEGTWFIQTLCKKITEMASTHDLESILTEVKREVAIDKEHVVRNPTGGVDVNKQIPVVTSTLIRKLYLRKYGEGGEYAATDNAEITPNVSVDTAQVGPSLDKCLCTLKYFSYIKTCLRHYVEGNPEDLGARSLLELTETFKSETEFDSAKEKCAEAISHYLDQNAKNTFFYKYMYFCNR